MVGKHWRECTWGCDLIVVGGISSQWARGFEFFIELLFRYKFFFLKLASNLRINPVIFFPLSKIFALNSLTVSGKLNPRLVFLATTKEEPLQFTRCTSCHARRTSHPPLLDTEYLFSLAKSDFGLGSFAIWIDCSRLSYPVRRASQSVCVYGIWSIYRIWLSYEHLRFTTVWERSLT